MLLRSPVRLHPPTDNHFPQHVPAQGWSWSLVGDGSRHKGRTNPVESEDEGMRWGKRRGKEEERWIERGNSSRIIRGPKYRAPRTPVVLPSLPRLSSGSIKRFTPCKLSTTLQSLPLLCHISGINVSKYAI